LFFFKSLIGASVRFCRMVLLGNRLKCWKTIPICWRYLLIFVLGSVISCPSKRICPAVGSSSRLRERRKVDFPEPEGPTITTTSPCEIVVLIFFNTSVSPKDLQRFLISNKICPSALTGTQPPFQSGHSRRKQGYDCQINQSHRD